MKKDATVKAAPCTFNFSLPERPFLLWEVPAQKRQVFQAEVMKGTKTPCHRPPQAAGAGALSGAAAWPDGGAGTRRVGV